MKLLVLSHTGGLLGGAEMSMLDVFDALTSKYDIEPQFILREPVMGLAGAVKKRGWKYHSLGYTFWSDSNPPKTEADIYRNFKQNVAAVKSIETIIDKFKPDIVVTNSIVCPWGAMAAHLQNKPHVWFVREYGDLDHGRIFELGREKTLADVNNLSNLVVTISKSLKSHLTKYMPEQKVTVLYNPFKLKEIIDKSTKSAPNPYKRKSSLKLVIAGNLAPSKGQLDVVKAVARLTKKGYDIELCAIGKLGEPDFNKEMNTFIETNNIKNRIHLVGFQENLLAYVKYADVGIMASRMEGFGRVTFEYLVLGKPVVGADSGATPEMVDNDKNGYLYKSGDITSLSSAIEHYAKNTKIIEEHSRASKKKARQLMSGDNNIDALYKKLVKVTKTEHSNRPPSINMFRKWEDYKKTAQRLDKKSNTPNLKQSLKRNARATAKKIYHKTRSLKARITGR